MSKYLNPSSFSMSLLLSSALVLAACGSDSSSDSSSGNSAPTVSAGSDQSVTESTTVTLTATSSDADGDTVSLTWSQLSGTDVTLSSYTDSSPTFTAPDVSADETLSFQVSATDGTDTSTDSVDITVTDTVEMPDYADYFEDDSLDSDPELVSCTLSGGGSSTCLSITLKSSPGNGYTVGPWCPYNISDDATEGGIWLESGSDYDVDGDFISNLNTFYNDSNWQMYDTTTGDINYTATQTECEAAARPDVDVAYQNYCVECQVSFIDDGLTSTYLIPVNPVDASSVGSTQTSGAGVAFSGIKMDGPAPTELILAAYTIAPFDDCGGHVNLNAGYHQHAVTDEGCLYEVEITDGHASWIGMALDGYPVYRRLNGTVEPTDLDSCRGHDTDEAYGVTGYHYHVDTAGSNAILGCLTGQTAN